MKVHYEGLVDRYTVVQGPNGPLTVNPAEGEALAVFRVAKFQEAYHDQLKATKAIGELDAEAQKAAQVLTHLREFLQNDGRLSADEVKILVEEATGKTSVLEVGTSLFSGLLGLIKRK